MKHSGVLRSFIASATPPLFLPMPSTPVGVYEVSTAETVCACFLDTWTE